MVFGLVWGLRIDDDDRPRGTHDGLEPDSSGGLGPLPPGSANQRSVRYACRRIGAVPWASAWPLVRWISPVSK